MVIEERRRESDPSSNTTDDALFSRTTCDKGTACSRMPRQRDWSFSTPQQLVMCHVVCDWTGTGDTVLLRKRKPPCSLVDSGSESKSLSRHLLPIRIILLLIADSLFPLAASARWSNRGVISFGNKISRSIIETEIFYIIQDLFNAECWDKHSSFLDRLMRTCKKRTKTRP